jgi:hypothetical protein
LFSFQRYLYYYLLQCWLMNQLVCQLDLQLDLSKDE